MLGIPKWYATLGGSIGGFCTLLSFGGFLLFPPAFCGRGFSGCGLLVFFGHTTECYAKQREKLTIKLSPVIRYLLSPRLLRCSFNPFSKIVESVIGIPLIDRK